MSDRVIKAVLFDLGETVLNFGKVDTTSLFHEGARLSYDYLKSIGQQLGNFPWYKWRNLTAIRLRYTLSNIIGNDFDSLELLKKIGIRAGYKISDEQWQHMVWLWYEPLSKAARIEDDITETLKELRDSGLKLGIVSNTFINGLALDKHLEQAGLIEYFPLRLYSYQFDFRKPDQRIFQKAASQIGEDMENIMFIGDRIDNDVSPAIQAGMKAVLKRTAGNTDKTLPNLAHEVKLLAELPELIRRINSENREDIADTERMAPGNNAEQQTEPVRSI